MNADNDHTELFERYLEGNLNDREFKEFEARLLIDPDFRMEFNIHKELDSALMQEEIMFFRAELETLMANQEAEEWEAPMMLSKAESDLLDEAILDQDVMSLKEQLGQIHAEVEAELENEYIPKYSGIERAVADQDSVLLHDELEKFDSNVLVGAKLTDEEVLDEEIDLAIMQSDVIDLRAKLDSIATELVTETKVIPMSTKIKRVVSIAAVVMVLLGSGIVSLNLAGTDQQVKRIIKSTINEMVDPGSARGVEEDANNMLLTAYSYFVEKDYEKAITSYETVDDGGFGIPESWIRLGECYYQIKDYENAVITLEKVIADDDNAFIEDADKLIFSSLWKLNRKDEAIAKLEKIVKHEDNHSFKSKAQEILSIVN